MGRERRGREDKGREGRGWERKEGNEKGGKGRGGERNKGKGREGREKERGRPPNANSWIRPAFGNTATTLPYFVLDACIWIMTIGFLGPNGISIGSAILHGSQL